MKRFRVTSYQKEAMSALLPPDDMTVWEWAEQYRVLDAKSGAIPGQWNNAITPYLVGIMDEFTNVETEEIIFVKPTQVGGTEVLLNMLGYVIAQDPSPAMIVYPSDKLAKQFVFNRFKPMIQTSPSVRDKYKVRQSSMLELQFDGMYVALTGANSPSSLSSRPIRFLFYDEVDKYPGASRKEADPIKLARERTKTFTNRKIYMTSTPTLKTGHIWQALESADIVKHFFVPCPHCGEFIELKFSQLKFPDNEGMTYTDRAEHAYYKCQVCEGIINDRQKASMLRYGVWEIVKRNTEYARKVAFWMNTLYSPFVRFSEVAKEFLLSKDNPETLQNFVNSWLAEPWEDSKLKTSVDTVLERQTEYEEFEVPDWALLLTAGVDVQETSLYWTIRAWGKYLTSQNIAHGQALDFADIEHVMNLRYRKRDGTSLVVSLCGVDSGDQTDAVYDFCYLNSDWAIPVKGVSKSLNSYKIATIDRAGSNANGMRLLLIDGGKYKDFIAARMLKPNGQGSWMVFKGCDEEYAKQVTAEHKVNIKNRGRYEQVWQQKTSHADNHYLDSEVYAFAVADVLEVRGLHLYQDDTSGMQTNVGTPPKKQWVDIGSQNWLGGD